MSAAKSRTPETRVLDILINNSCPPGEGIPKRTRLARGDALVPSRRFSAGEPSTDGVGDSCCSQREVLEETLDEEGRNKPGCHLPIDNFVIVNQFVKFFAVHLEGIGVREGQARNLEASRRESISKFVIFVKCPYSENRISETNSPITLSNLM